MSGGDVKKLQVAGDLITFNGNAFAGPLFFKGGEAFSLADADDMLLEVKFFCVKAQEPQPQLSHRLCVRLQL